MEYKEQLCYNSNLMNGEHRLMSPLNGENNYLSWGSTGIHRIYQDLVKMPLNVRQVLKNF